MMDDFIKSRSIQDYCRVCFQSASELISCLTTLIIEKCSFSIMEILNSLSPGLQDSSYKQFFPKGICSDCKEVIMTMMLFKLKYKKTSQLLEKLFIEYETEKKNFKIQFQTNRKDGECDQNFSYHETQMETAPILENWLPQNMVTDIADEEEQILLLIECGNEDINRFPKIENNDLDTSVDETETQKKSNVVDENLFSQRKIIINHICPMCRIQLTNAAELRKHATTHKILRRYQKGLRVPNNARFVAKPLESLTIFNRVEKLHHCVYCSTELPIEDFQTHMIAHHNQNEYHCDKCSRVFNKLSHLKNHIIFSHLKSLPYQCGYCDKMFVLKINYECHILTHSQPDNLPYKCGKCSKTFANKKHLYHHSFRHTDEGSFWIRYKILHCNSCLRSFKSAQDLQKHKLDCTNIIKKKVKCKQKFLRKADGSFVCGICSKRYNDITTIKTHIQNSHNPKYLCARCGLTVTNIKQHMICHQTKQTQQCHICQKILSSKITLAKHYRVHSHERPYQCTFCGKGFKKKHTVQVHERIHLKNRKHVCPACGKSFLEKSYMIKHLKRVHLLTYSI